MLTKSQKNLDFKQQVKIIVESIKAGDNIWILSKKLDKTIAQTSRILADCARLNEKFRLAIKKRRWPTNVNAGHIFLGDKHKQLGEHNNMLRVGDYVLVGAEINRNNSIYCEIHRPEETEETLYEFGVYDPKARILAQVIENSEKMGFSSEKLKVLKKKLFKNFRVISSEWFADEDITRDKHKRFATEYELKLFRKTNKKRLVYRAGMWLGTPDKRSLVAVNYDGR